MSTEAFSVVDSILSDIISNVVSKTFPLISPSDLEDNQDRERLLDQSDTTTGGVDLSILLMLLPGEDMVTSIADRKSGVHVHQLKVAKQYYGHYCGHYAFNFAMCACKLFRSRDVSSACMTIEQIKCKVSNWKRYWHTVGVLCAQAEAGSNAWWPWTEDAIHSGCLERTFMKHLLESLPKAVQNHVLSLQYGYGMFQEETSDLIRIQKTIDRFSASRGPAHIVFIVGVVNHWVCLMAFKNDFASKHRTLQMLDNLVVDELPHLKCIKANLTNIYRFVEDTYPADNSLDVLSNGQNGSIQAVAQSSRKDDVHLLFFDSNNFNSPCMKDEDLQGLVEKGNAERIARGRQPYNNWERSNCRQAYLDQRDVIFVLARSLAGKSSLLEEFIDGRIGTLVNSYTEHVCQPFQGGTDPCMYACLLLAWLEMFNRPAHIHNRFLSLIEEVGKTYLGSTGRQRLQFFVDDVLLNLGQGDWSTVPLIHEMLKLTFEIKYNILE